MEIVTKQYEDACNLSDTSYEDHVEAAQVYFTEPVPTVVAPTEAAPT